MPDATQAGFSYGLASIPKWATFSLLLTVIVYLRGWRALQATRPEQIPGWRAACFLAGMLSVFLAIASPLDALSGVLLTAHMIQHLLLMAIAPPLLVLGAPVVPLLRGLPKFFVREGLGPFFSLRAVHALQRLFASRVLAWLLMNLAFIAWHVPAAYDLALRSPGWHEVEHACFLFTSVLFWWHIVAPWPTTYVASRWLLLPFLLTADIVNTGLSAILTFSGRVVYPAYAQAPRLSGLSVLGDQVAAGALMWVVGSVAFLGAAMLITVQLLSRRGERRRLYMNAARARLASLRREVRQTESAAGLSFTKPLHAGQKVRSGDARGGLDLLHLRPVRAFLRSRYGRQSLQALSLLIAAAIIVDGLFGHQMASMNLAGIVPWTYGRGIFVLALLLCGNLFCMSCPFTLPREAAKWVVRRLGISQFRWPRALRNKWLSVGLVALFFWAYEALGLWNSPLRTAWLLLAYIATTFAIDAVFRDASFCKYVCPLGQFNFVSSLLSPVEIAPRSLSTCGTCSTRDCIAGHGPVAGHGDPRPATKLENTVAYQRGCELHLFLPEKQGNMDCTLCMDCVKACPHDNVGLFFQPPALDLVQLGVRDPQRSAVGRYSQRLDIAVLAATVIAAAFASAAVMVAPVAGLLDRVGASMPSIVGNTAGLLLAAALPAGLLGSLTLAVLPMRANSGARAEQKKSIRESVPKWMLALLPVGLGMWAAHLSFHLVTAWDSLLPGILQAGHELARVGIALHGLPSPDWMNERPLLDPGSLLGLQLALLDAGLLGTLYLGWRMGRNPVINARVATGVVRRARLLLPWASVAIALYAAGVWILLQPMQMRGMVGM
jgi:cytochrome c oxidase assembly factor CtaG/ferredoxin